MKRIGSMIVVALVAVWLAGSDTTTASTHQGQLQPRIYPCAISQIHPQALASMRSLQWDIRHHDPASGLIHAATPQTAVSEVAGIAVSMRQVNGSVQVDISCSAAKAGTAKTWIDAFYRELDQRAGFSR
jgi:hypothetical protein